MCRTVQSSALPSRDSAKRVVTQDTVVKKRPDYFYAYSIYLYL